jgi:ankyrin repeat protein
MKLLIDNGADINARNNYGCTPLTYAANNNNTEIMKLLVDNGVLVDNGAKE